MEEDDNEQIEEQYTQPEDRPDFIQEFIDRKKLQNRILREIIDKIIQAEDHDKSPTTN